MDEKKVSTLLSDVSIEGDIVEKDKIVIDAKINGDIKSDEVETYPNSNINGNIKSKSVLLGGKIKGIASESGVDFPIEFASYRQGSAFVYDEEK